MNISALPTSHQAAQANSGGKNNRIFFLQLAVLIALSVLVEIFRAAQLQGFARAESCFIEGAREMFFNKQYVAPLLYNVPYFDKPPLYYWLIISSYKIFGVSLLSARAVSILIATLTTTVTAIFVKKIIGKHTALLSTIILISNVGFSELASIAMPDMLLCLFANLAMFCAFEVFFFATKQRLLYLSIMSLSFALGWMTKGPIAILIPLITLGISFLVLRQKPKLSLSEFTLCSFIFFAILAPWHIAVYQQYGLSAFNWLYIQGNIGRFIGEHSSYNFGHQPAYMLLNLLGNFLPWTVFAVPATLQLIVTTLIPRNFTNINKFLLLMLFWIFANTSFFTLSHSNWGYYSLPIYPALSIITAYSIISLEKRFSPRKLAIGYLTVAIAFFAGIVIYTLAFLPAKAKANTFLNFASPIKQFANKIPLVVHTDLYGQYLLIDHIIFQSEHMPSWCKQDKLNDLLASDKSFIILMPKIDYEQLNQKQKASLNLLHAEHISWLAFPGCQLLKQARAGEPIELLLLEYSRN